jgi:hypothetical protein
MNADQLDDGWSIERHLDGKPAGIVALYRRFIALADECGPFTYRVTKTAITLKGTRRGFAGAVPKTRSLNGYLDLQAQVRDPRIRSAAPYTQRLVVHQFRVTELGQLDSEFAAWLQAAYAVGAGAHLRS